MLEWKRLHPEAVGCRTKCGRYSVNRVTDDGSRWEVWKLAPGGPWFALLAKDLGSEHDAMLAAERDAA